MICNPINIIRHIIYRRELEEFVIETKCKYGSDGKPLVLYPENFDSVTDVMNRKDIHSTEDRYR